jgi:UMP-CMP kinase
LRRERLTGSEKGKLIESYLKEGNIVPVELSLGLLKQEILESNEDRYLIDGFPRNYDNLHGWLRVMPDVCDIELVVFIECGEEEMEKRLLNRGLTSNRSDDNAATVKKRFYTFQNDSLPVIRHFEENQSRFPFLRLNGDQTVDLVYEKLKTAVATTIEQDLLNINRQLTQEVVNHADNSEMFSKYSSNPWMGDMLFQFELQQVSKKSFLFFFIEVMLLGVCRCMRIIPLNTKIRFGRKPCTSRVAKVLAFLTPSSKR